MDVFTNLEALQNLYFWDFMEASSCRHDWSLTPFLALLPSLDNGGGAENSKLLIMAWSYQWPALIQEPTQSHLIRGRDAPSALTT